MKQGQPTNNVSEIEIRPWHEFESEFLKKRDEMILRDFAEIPRHSIASLACTYGLSPRRIKEILTKDAAKNTAIKFFPADVIEQAVRRRQERRQALVARQARR